MKNFDLELSNEIGMLPELSDPYMAKMWRKFVVLYQELVTYRELRPTSMQNTATDNLLANRFEILECRCTCGKECACRCHDE